MATATATDQRLAADPITFARLGAHLATLWAAQGRTWGPFTTDTTGALAAGILDHRQGRPADPSTVAADHSARAAYYGGHRAAAYAATLRACGFTTTTGLSARDWRALREIAGLPAHQAPDEYVRGLIEGVLLEGPH